MSWYMLFADDIVLVGEFSDELNMKVEEWRAALESKGLHLSTTKIEYMCPKFGEIEQQNDLEVYIGQDDIAGRTKFKYFGLIIQSDGKVDGDVTHQIQAGGLKWRATTIEFYAIRSFLPNGKVNSIELPFRMLCCTGQNVGMKRKISNIRWM